LLTILQYILCYVILHNVIINCTHYTLLIVHMSLATCELSQLKAAIHKASKGIYQFIKLVKSP